MNQVIVRYRVKPDRAAENVELVRAVYDELERTKPAGLRYVTFQLDDGVSFVHVAVNETDSAQSLTELAAFKAFQREIADCEERPQVTEAREVGSYRFFDRGRQSEAVHPNPVVHLELHTADLVGASALYSELCGWLRAGGDRCGAYLRSSSGPRSPPAWSRPAPAARSGSREVDRIDEATGAPVGSAPRWRSSRARARRAWRSVVSTPCGGELAFWQPKEARDERP